LHELQNGATRPAEEYRHSRFAYTNTGNETSTYYTNNHTLQL
jgi:hypothetical protein